MRHPAIDKIPFESKQFLAAYREEFKCWEVHRSPSGYVVQDLPRMYHETVYENGMAQALVLTREHFPDKEMVDEFLLLTAITKALEVIQPCTDA